MGMGKVIEVVNCGVPIVEVRIDALETSENEKNYYSFQNLPHEVERIGDMRLALGVHLEAIESENGKGIPCAPIISIKPGVMYCVA